MPKLKVVKIFDEVYNTTIVFYHGSGEDIRKDMIKRYEIDVGEMDDAAGIFRAVVNKKTKQDVMVIGIIQKSASTIVHECLHAAVYIMRDRGIPIKKGNNEALCYYHGWLVAEAGKAVYGQK
jgi:hypothetical protein